jgi:hypothetical protein
MEHPHREDDPWRAKAALLASNLDHTRMAVSGLETMLNHDEPPAAQRRRRSEIDQQLSALTGEVRALRAHQPPPPHADRGATLGLPLAIEGSETAALALDVMVDAITALHEVEDGLDTEILLGACIDAERAFEDATVILRATAYASGFDMVKLDQAFHTDGQSALRDRLISKGTDVETISRRCRHTGRTWFVRR